MESHRSRPSAGRCSTHLLAAGFRFTKAVPAAGQHVHSSGFDLHSLYVGVAGLVELEKGVDFLEMTDRTFTRLHTVENEMHKAAQASPMAFAKLLAKLESEAKRLARGWGCQSAPQPGLSMLR